MDSKARPAAAGNRVYEEVQPQYKWLPGESFDTFLVDLRAFENEEQFMKEHLKVQIDNYGNIRVSGERPLDGNRWRRFQKVQRLSEDYDHSGIRATYNDGVLSVVVPKLAKDTPAKKPPTATQAAPASTKEPVAAPATAETGKPAAPAKEETRKPAAAAGAPPPKEPEDRKSRPPKPAGDGKSDDALQAAQEKGKEQVTSAPAGDGRVAATTDKKETEPAAGDAGLTPSPPVPAGKTTADVRKPPAPAEAKTLSSGTLGLDLGALRRRPRRLLVNVVVAVLLLVGLGFYFIYRHRATPDDQNQPGSLSVE